MVAVADEQDRAAIEHLLAHEYLVLKSAYVETPPEIAALAADIRACTAEADRILAA